MVYTKTARTVLMVMLESVNSRPSEIHLNCSDAVMKTQWLHNSASLHGELKSTSSMHISKLYGKKASFILGEMMTFKKLPAFLKTKLSPFICMFLRTPCSRHTRYLCSANGSSSTQKILHHYVISCYISISMWYIPLYHYWVYYWVYIFHILTFLKAECILRLIW